ncbi:P-loop containing nucleoside triphosphate hydrolase protein [Phyllosticta capitalensis]
MAPLSQLDIWRQRFRTACTLAISSHSAADRPLVLGDGLQDEDAVRRAKAGLPPALEKTNSQIICSFTIANCQHFDSYVEVSIEIPCEPACERNQAGGSETATIRLNRDDVKDAENQPTLVRCRRIDMGNASELTGLFGFDDTTLQSYINAAGLSLLPRAVFLLSVPFAPKPPSRNMMEKPGRHGFLAETFERVKESFQNGGTLHALFSTYTPFTQVELLNSKISEYRAHDPLADFYGAIGLMKPKSARPQLKIERQFLFSTWRHYRTILECALMEERELLEGRGGVRRGAMRLISIPHTENTQFFGFLDHDTAAYKLREGDALSVSVNSTEESDYHNSATTWNATVISQIPFAPSNTTPVLLHREFSEEDGTYDRQDVSSISLGTIKSASDSKTALMSVNPVPVVYTLQTNDEAPSRLTRSLHRLDDADNFGWAHAALLGHGGTAERTIDLFSGIQYDKLALRAMELAISRLNPEQAAALQMTRSLPRGIGIVQGPPGTGKTFMISNLVQPVIWRTKRYKGPSVLILSTSNLSVDDLTERVQSTCAEFATKLSLDRKPVVLRVHSSATESHIVREEVDLAESLSSSWDSDQSSVTKALSSAYKRANDKPFGVDDKRLRLIDNSLGKFMLQVAGLPDSEFTTEEKRVVDLFKAFRSQYKAGTLPKDRMESFRRAEMAFRDVALVRADVVVMTLANSGSAGLYRAIHPRAIIVDEAARASDPEIWSIFAWYRKNTTRLIVGDSCQLQPVAEHNNPLRDQLTLSALARLQSLGYPHIQLREQRRSSASIMDVYSKAYYDGSLTTCAEFDKNFQPKLDTFKTFLREKHGVDTPQSASLFQLGCGSSSLDASGSWVNVTNARVAMQAAVDIHSYGVEASRIAILTPYTAQCSLYLTARSQLSEKDSTLATLNIETFDSIQGREFDHTIVDFVRTDRLGFLSDGNRVNVALSRSRFGMIVVMHYDGLSTSKGWASSGLQTAMSVLKKNQGCNTYFKAQDVEDMVKIESA